MALETRCFHSRTAEEQETTDLEVGALVEVVVACQHVFGVGVYIPSCDAWGHVNITEMNPEIVERELLVRPLIGMHLMFRVAGRRPMGSQQLVLTRV